MILTAQRKMNKILNMKIKEILASGERPLNSTVSRPETSDQEKSITEVK
jgi:hypothetical protein